MTSSPSMPSWAGLRRKVKVFLHLGAAQKSGPKESTEKQSESDLLLARDEGFYWGMFGHW